MPEVNRTELESRLYFAGKERDRARAKADEATGTIAGLLPQARADGLSVKTLMELTGLSRQGVYNLLAKGRLTLGPATVSSEPG